MNDEQFTVNQLIEQLNFYPKSVVVEKHDILLRDKAGFTYTMKSKKEDSYSSKRVEK